MPDVTAEDAKLLAQAGNDLVFLQQAGALTGVCQVIAERRKQIGELGWTPEHDAGHTDGWLMWEAHDRTLDALQGVTMRGESYQFAEKSLCQAAALAAAEIDRRNRVPGPAETEADACESVLCDDEEDL